MNKPILQEISKSSAPESAAAVLRQWEKDRTQPQPPKAELPPIRPPGDIKPRTGKGLTL